MAIMPTLNLNIWMWQQSWPLRILTKYIMSYFYQVLANPVSVEKYTPVPTPADSYQHRTTCQWSDTDVLGHMNNSHYIRMCSDALSAAVHCKSQAIPDHFKVISMYCCMPGCWGFKTRKLPGMMGSWGSNVTTGPWKVQLKYVCASLIFTMDWKVELWKAMVGRSQSRLKLDF